MAESQDSQAPKEAGKGKAFFDRGDQVAETGNWDFAIQMYLEGIRREPDNLERGHKRLRDVSLNRKAQGGKPVGFMEAMKHRPTKDALENLINAEFLLAKDPGRVEHMGAVMKAAVELKLAPVVKYIGDIILDAMRQAKKPDRRLLVTVAEGYAAVNEFASAVQACDMALRANPEDGLVQDMARNYSAQATIKQGQYGTEGSFTRGVRDMDKQVELTQRDAMSQGRDFMEKDIAKARAAYEQTPNAAGKIDALADALLKIEEEAYENEAVDVLKKAYADSKAYRFKVRIDDVKIRQIRRRYNKLREAGQTAEAAACARELLAFELGVYEDRAANYPTDLSIKYELGRRQLTAGRIDEAIASLQQAQREPKRRIRALTYLGQAFARKGWHPEAVETYEKALEFDPTEQHAKEIHYLMALSLKALGETEKALGHFSDVAQMDYNYRDVRQQIEELRRSAG